MFVVLLVGCGGDDPPPVGTGAFVDVDVGAAGGTVELEGARLEIPAGALSTTERITLTSTTEAAPAGLTNQSPIYSFVPAGLQFEVPAEITISFVGDAANAKLLWSEDGVFYTDLGGTVAGDAIIAEIEHFSRGFVGSGAIHVPDGSVCPLGQNDCNGRCVDLQYDSLHCGECGMVCPVVDGGAACFEGECSLGGP